MWLSWWPQILNACIICHLIICFYTTHAGLQVTWHKNRKLMLSFSQWLWKEPVMCLDHSRCSKWRPFAFTHVSVRVCHWSMALSMMPWEIRSQMSMLQLVNVAFQFLCNVRYSVKRLDGKFVFRSMEHSRYSASLRLDDEFFSAICLLHSMLDETGWKRVFFNLLLACKSALKKVLPHSTVGIPNRTMARSDVVRTRRWQQRTVIQQYGDSYIGRWWVGCYIWYCKEGLPRSTKCNSPPLNGQCTTFVLFDVNVTQRLCLHYKWLYASFLPAAVYPNVRTAPNF